MPIYLFDKTLRAVTHICLDFLLSWRTMKE